MLAAGGEDKKWSLWRGIKGHKSTVSCIKFIDATDRLVTGSWDKYARALFVAATREEGGGAEHQP
jgi:WD40 repeat protein